MFSTNQKVIIARIISFFVVKIRHFLRLKAITISKRRGLFWELNLEEGIDLSIYILGSFEPSTLKAYSSIINQGDIVFDIGANIGSHTLPLAHLVGVSGRVFSFEPTQFAYKKQLCNLALNPGLNERVVAEQIMLVRSNSSNVPEEVHSSWPLTKTQNLHAGHLGALKSTSGARAISLDSYVQMSSINRMDFIKLDVDGYELDVLSGATQCIAKFRPIILLELAPYVFEDTYATFDDLIYYFHNLGYDFYSISSRTPLGRDMEVIRSWIPENGSINVLAIFGLAELAK